MQLFSGDAVGHDDVADIWQVIANADADSLRRQLCGDWVISGAGGTRSHHELLRVGDHCADRAVFHCSSGVMPFKATTREPYSAR